MRQHRPSTDSATTLTFCSSTVAPMPCPLPVRVRAEHECLGTKRPRSSRYEAVNGLATDSMCDERSVQTQVANASDQPERDRELFPDHELAGLPTPPHLTTGQSFEQRNPDPFPVHEAEQREPHVLHYLDAREYDGLRRVHGFLHGSGRRETLMRPSGSFVEPVRERPEELSVRYTRRTTRDKENSSGSAHPRHSVQQSDDCQIH